MTRRTVWIVLWAAWIALPLVSAQEKVDLLAVHRIRAEALNNPKVMEHVFYLTDVHGPRLAGSPGYRAAAEWAVKQLKEWGIDNARLEGFGSMGRSWSFVHYAGRLVEPQPAPLIGFPLAWTPGTNGKVSAEPVLAPMPLGNSDEELEKTLAAFRGKLRGKIVLIDNPRELELVVQPLARRFTDAELASEALAPDPRPESPFAAPIPRPQGPPAAPGPRGPFDREGVRRRANRRIQFLKEEGALVVVSAGLRGDRGTIFATSFGSREPKDPLPPPAVAIAIEHYNRIARLLNKKIPVRLEFEIETRFHDDAQGYNVIAEIPGGSKKEEIVMLGAHLDSWIAGTGATDNAAGCAVMLEAMRILKTLDFKMDRTVRLALWDGEEQGFLGSRAYVKEHFADRETMALKPAHAKLAAYFNLDNGSGRIRGVYLQNNDMVRPIFQAWLEPFRDLGATTLTIRNTGGTDHLSFDEVGLPGFQFIQDPLEYSTRTHHSNMDLYDHVRGGDLMQASAVVASFAYHAAMRPEMLPRKPLPKPRPRPESKAEGGPSGG
ncbi:MAG: M20/M25/M40 family metallo-hydrolase [Bryobacteraceae bacterium]|nr:M20/M25/M40 family metallo-hydrolase [Bryobacteraceae bacterium]